MRLLLKLSLGILVLNASILGVVTGQRYLRPTDLDRALQLSETDCGRDCWFGIPSHEAMNWRDVQANVESAGGADMRFRGGKMHFRLPDEENSDLNIGHIQVIFDDEGNSLQTCFFVNQFTLGDILTTFGTPEYFWLDINSERFSFSNNVNQPQYYYINYELLYPDDTIVVQGVMKIDAQTNLPLESKNKTVPLNTPVDWLCTPANLDYINIQHLSTWRGIFADLNDYRTTPPRRISDPVPIEAPYDFKQLP